MATFPVKAGALVVLLTLPLAAATGGPGVSTDPTDPGVALLEVWSDSAYHYRISAVMGVLTWSYEVSWDWCSTTTCGSTTLGPYPLAVGAAVWISPPDVQSGHLLVTGSHSHYTPGGNARFNYCVEVSNGNGGSVVAGCA